MAQNSNINEGTAIPFLPQAQLPLNGSELIPIQQGNKTVKASVTDVQKTAYDTAVAAQTTATNAANSASAAQTAANSAATAAANAQSTANGKLSTVAVDGTTITGDGTSGNPLVANIPVSPKEYRGYLTISAGGVTFTSLQNDVGNIVWSVVGNGALEGVLSGAFLSNKFWGISGSLNAGNVPYITITRRLFDNTIRVDIFKFDGTQSGTPFGTFPIQLIINN